MPANEPPYDPYIPSGGNAAGSSNGQNNGQINALKGVSGDFYNIIIRARGAGYGALSKEKATTTRVLARHQTRFATASMARVKLVNIIQYDLCHCNRRSDCRGGHKSR